MLGVPSFHDARPRGVSVDYLRGRCVKTTPWADVKAQLGARSRRIAAEPTIAEWERKNGLKG